MSAMAEKNIPRSHDLADLTEVIHELVDARQHRQSYRAGWAKPNRTSPIIRDHVTDQRSLLNQLRDAITDRADTSTGGRAGRIAYTEMPRFSADAFDRMEAIRSQVASWCTILEIGSEGEQRAGLIARYCDQIALVMQHSRVNSYSANAALDVLRNVATYIRTAVEVDMLALMRKAAETDSDTVVAIADDAERWRTWCRIVAGWETPALRPHVPCPHCGTVAGERAGLRVRIDGASGAGGILDDAAVRAAVCLTCNRTWDADTVGLLAEELRRANRENDDAPVDLLDGAA